MRQWHWIALTAAALALSAANLPAQTAPTDDQIEIEIEAQVANSQALNGQAIGVWTHDGTVTLSGQVKDQATRQAAEDIVKKIDGVKSVEDHLRLPGEQGPELQTGAGVAGETPAAQQPAEQPSAAAEQTAPGNASTPAQVPTAPPQYPEPSQDRTSNYPPPAPQRYPAPPQRAYERYPQPPRLQAPNGPVTLPPGTVVNIRMQQGLDTRHTQPGTLFRGNTAQNVFVRGYVAIPRGTPVEGSVVDVQTSGDFKGSPKLTLQLTALTLDDKTYPVQSDIWSRKGPGKGQETISNSVGGAAVGAVIGAIAGGGVGAAIGAGVGGVAAAGVTGAVPGRNLLLPPEAILTFSLAAPLTVQPIPQDELDRLVAAQQDQRMNAPGYGYPPRRAYPYPPYPPPPYPPPPPYYYGHYGPYYRYW
jgi:hypothetical protein